MAQQLKNILSVKDREAIIIIIRPPLLAEGT